MPSTCTTAEAAERFNKEEGHLRRVLRDSLAFAIALNRTLVSTGAHRRCCRAC